MTHLIMAITWWMAQACATIHHPQEQGLNIRPLAFPGAEGYGKYATGGRGGKIFIVTNLNDKGPGSFREAAESKMPRMILFAVSGTIHLETPLGIRENVTIAGHSAPGDGICIADRPVSLKGNNIIIRYLRFRMGDKYERGEKVDGSGSADALGAQRRNQVIIDHCSISWSTDEAFSVYLGDSTTLQWNLIAEPLNYSYHFEKGDTDFEQHGYGGIWGGQHLSAHHNLFAHCNSRTPRLNGSRNGSPEFVDYQNNVVYNWGANNIYAGEGGTYNIVNNYFKPGPSTKKSARSRFLNPYKKGDEIPFGKFYVAGNEAEGFPEVLADNGKGVELNKGTEEERIGALVKTPFSSIEVPLVKAKKAYEEVLSGVGASFKRDTLDLRILRDVEQGTGKLIDVQGGFPRGTAFELTKNAWPELKSQPAPADSDKDGMPDVWEKSHQLNPADAADANQVDNVNGYTNLELYLHSLLENQRNNI